MKSFGYRASRSMIARLATNTASTSIIRNPSCVTGKMNIPFSSRLFASWNESGPGSAGGGGRGGGRNILDDEPPEIKALIREAEDKSNSESGDPFGVHFEDGKEGLGPSLPPLYQRDATTGRLTGEIVAELSEQDKKVLAADYLEQDAIILDRIESHWSYQQQHRGKGGDKRNHGDIDDGLPAELHRLGERIRLSDMATNVLGRSVKAQATAEQLDDGSELGRDSSGFSQHLTQGEFKTFQQYMKVKHKIEGLSTDDIPVQETASSKSRKATSVGDNPDSADWSLKWLSARAQRQMDDSLDDNPYSDVMPGDLSPNRIVNRKRAKQIPRALLHHNNLALLQNFISPTGQIRNRMQTRLGARDQRRVARLVKRSRALGLIPFVGQFKAEQHGWVNAPDIHTDRPWETDLVQRGLVIQKFVPKKSPDSTGSSS